MSLPLVYERFRIEDIRLIEDPESHNILRKDKLEMEQDIVRSFIEVNVSLASISAILHSRLSVTLSCSLMFMSDEDCCCTLC